MIILCCMYLLVIISTIAEIIMNWLVRLMTSQLVIMLDWTMADTDSSVAECLEKGFNSAKLLCSSCDDLKQFDLGVLAQDCAACCISDGGSASLENTKYEKAILEVCG